MDPLKKSQIIKTKARELGFNLVGITSCSYLCEIEDILQHRKSDGTLPVFITQDVSLLSRPKLLLNSSKSIISLGLAYTYNHNEDSELYISSYARGLDYHQIMKKKLIKLENFIKDSWPDVKTRSFTDNAPLLEKKIAEKAGLGWIGKNSCLINEKFGSFIFLGEIITTLELAYDQLHKNKCGNCQKCIEACPGQALIRPYYLDSKHCISYLTQKNGILTEEEREKINNNLWGCDTCQNVCPYNQKINIAPNEEFTSKINPDVIKILSFSKDNFPENWRQSALSWRGPRILKRNTLLVIANNNYRQYIPTVKKLLNDTSPIIKGYAFWCLNKLNFTFAKDDLLKSKRNEKNEFVREEINKIISKQENR